MKRSRSEVRSKVFKIPQIRFEDQKLTSFAGLVVFQGLFAHLDLKQQLRRCFAHWQGSPTYDPASLVLLLIVHLLLGFRNLRDLDYYKDDPMILRVLGLNCLPDVSVLSRFLARSTQRCVVALRSLSRQGTLLRLAALGLRRITLDFDGSVLGTGRAAEGTAVGFNSKKKGQRSYYPLFCTVAQTGQVLDFLFRPGNVHDSRGAESFICDCVLALRSILPGVHLEVRMDSAFFSDKIIQQLKKLGVEFTVSVPFERFDKLKTLVEKRRIWHRLNGKVSYFYKRWKPKSWKHHYRFLFVRTRSKVRPKGPIQLELFVPFEYGYDFKVIITNKKISARKVVAFHDGRGAQEAVFAELKSQAQLDYVPTRTRNGNQIFLLTAILAHNLARELQMLTKEPRRPTTEKRSPLWCFQQLATLRHHILQRAGRLNRPNGILTLTLSTNDAVKRDLLNYLPQLHGAYLNA